MAQAKSYSSGWFGQTIRHSNARRFGRAGGNYARQYNNAIELKKIANNPKHPNHKILILNAKKPLENHLLQAIRNEKNTHKKKQLYFLLEELEKADTKSKFNTWWKTYKYNIQTLELSIPFAVTAPLLLAGIITATAMGEIEAGEGVAKMGMFGVISYAGAMTTKGTIKNIGLIKKFKKKEYLKALQNLEKSNLSKEEKEEIAHKVSDMVTLEKSREVKHINPKIQKSVI